MTEPRHDGTPEALVVDSYRRLAAVLEASPAEVWDHGSMCDGWRVREVVAHMTMPARYSAEAFTEELKACDYDFHRFSNTVAVRDGGLPSDRLLADLRSDQLHRWQPPGGGVEGALTHVVVHALDVTVPLGAPSAAPEAAIRQVLDLLTSGGAHEHFGTDIAGRRFEATDLDWSYGPSAAPGEPERAPAADILLRLTGRRIPAGETTAT